jgi:hypothetical protein
VIARILPCTRGAACPRTHPRSPAAPFRSVTQITVSSSACPHTRSPKMNEAEYQARYRQFHAFTNCEARAAYRVTDDADVAKVSEGASCYSTDGVSLFLCAECLKFWKDCRRTDDITSWEMAVFLRTSRKDRASSVVLATARFPCVTSASDIEFGLRSRSFRPPGIQKPSS